jgi:hypothetical protein
MSANLVAAGVVMALVGRDEGRARWTAWLVAGAWVLALITLGFWVFSTNDVTF